jgi:F-type H+-transporting ATPase subunit epsilon
MQLHVTTPRGYLVQAEVDEVAAPGALGEFDILPGHIPFMSVLKPGVLLYVTKDGRRYLAVGDGILQISRSTEGDKVLVLVDRGEHGREIDKDEAQKELASLDAELAKAKPETMAELKLLDNRRAFAAAKLDAATRG